jgi:hypothetical protein
MKKEEETPEEGRRNVVDRWNRWPAMGGNAVRKTHAMGGNAAWVQTHSRSGSSRPGFGPSRSGQPGSGRPQRPKAPATLFFDFF